MTKFYTTFRPLALTLPALAVSVFVAGCSLMPTYERPVAPIAAQWPDAAAVERSDKNSIQPLWNKGWEAFYADTTVQELISIALANNRDLRVSVLNIEQARAQLGLRRADQFPSVNAGLTGSRVPASDGGISSSYTGGLIFTAYELDFLAGLAASRSRRWGNTWPRLKPARPPASA